MILGIAGWSGSGKTTLIKKLIPILKKNGLEVSTLKHAHSGFEIDHRGKDSYEHRTAGAKEVMVSSSKRFALTHEYSKEEYNLKNLIKKMKHVDLIIVEGWKKEKIKKIEVYREELNKPLLAKTDKNIIAIATNNKNIKLDNVIIFSLNSPDEIVKFIKALMKKSSNEK